MISVVVKTKLVFYHVYVPRFPYFVHSDKNLDSVKWDHIETCAEECGMIDKQEVTYSANEMGGCSVIWGGR